MGRKSIAVAFGLAAASPIGNSVRGAVCSLIELQDDKAPEWIQLFPPGPDIEAVDGRRFRLSDPGRVGTESLAAGLDLAVDWEHSQHHKAPKGEEAPAAGWIRGIEMRGGVLMGRVDWNPRGRRSIEGREYRYISPDFQFDKTSGEVLRLRGVGLVNRPGLVMPALASAQAREGESGMKEILKKILEALGLADDATAEQAVASIATLRAERDRAVASAAAPSLANFVPRADHDAAVARADTAEAKVAELEGASLEADIKRELDAAQEAGKITPATRSYHAARCREEDGLKDFREFVKAAPKIAEPSRISGSPPDGSTATGFASAEEAAVAAALGRDAAFLDKHAPRQGAN